jgi:hypothetical protein
MRESYYRQTSNGTRIAFLSHRTVSFSHLSCEARQKRKRDEEIITCGLIIEQRTHHQITGEPRKCRTLADWTGMVEAELFAPTYRSYGLATVRYPVSEVTDSRAGPRHYSKPRSNPS